MSQPDTSHPRFVLLEHETDTGVHWDLLVELPNKPRLASWRLAADPTEDDFPIPAEPIQPHRKAYLDYQGPISGDRGLVRRIDRGDAAATVSADKCATLELHGSRIGGSFVIKLDRAKYTLNRLD